MNILSIDSALNNSYLGIEYDKKLYSKIIKTDKNYHSLYLISKIKEILYEKNIELKNISLITVNSGPGSFTGIRIALTIAKILAQELNISIIPLKSNEILLRAYNKKYLLMDARKDMYFFTAKDKIELIYKDKLPKNLNENELLVDRRTKEIFSSSCCYEDIDIDLSKTMIELAKDKYLKTENKEVFSYINAKANYIQTPPVF